MLTAYFQVKLSDRPVAVPLLFREMNDAEDFKVKLLASIAAEQYANGKEFKLPRVTVTKTSSLKPDESKVLGDIV